MAEAQGPNNRDVFLVHGRDHVARVALEALLKAFDLRVVSWDKATRVTGTATPYTGDVVRAGMDIAKAVVVLLTPDDIGQVSPRFREDWDGPDEVGPTGQARLNVIFEAGMAMAIDRHHVVLVEVGPVRSMTDTAGLNVVRLDNSIESRRRLATRLEMAGLAVDTEHEDWRTAGDIPENVPADKKTLGTARAEPGRADGGSVKDLLARFDRYAQTSAPSRIFEALLGDGWVPNPPAKTYIRWTFAGALRQVTIYQNSRDLVVNGRNEKPVVTDLGGAEIRPSKNDIHFSYAQDPANALAAAASLRAYAEGKAHPG
jgi:Predicted nucleotide-binding protein containing TIR-like domain